MTWIIVVFFIIAGIISAVTGIPFWVPVVAGLAVILIGYVSVVYYKVFTRRGIIRTRAFVMAELRRKRLDHEKRIADACEESGRNHRKYLRESNRQWRHPRKRCRYRSKRYSLNEKKRVGVNVAALMTVGNGGSGGNCNGNGSGYGC